MVATTARDGSSAAHYFLAVRLLTACAVGLQAIAPVSLPAQQNGSVAGEWLLTQQIFGYPQYCRLTLTVTGQTLAGTACGAAIEGSVSGAQLQFSTKGSILLTEFTGRVVDGQLAGSLVRQQILGRPPLTTTWDARRILAPPAGPPRRHEFVPTAFYREFSATAKPALTIWPGDTVHTTTLDAEGFDEHGVQRALGGNPQTGPIYVESAMPGDLLVVHLVRLRLNRSWANSSDSLVASAMNLGFGRKMSYFTRPLRWNLDREGGFATLESPHEHLKDFRVLLRPMLGCIAVAPPGFAASAPPTFEAGRYGGNMDFNEVVEGTTVFLPVSQPGALLYLGDGHAAQGSGELNGAGLETSLDVELRVDLIRSKSIMTPRIESASHLMTVGLSGTLDEALRSATASMGQWLEQDYALSPPEIAVVLGSIAEYTVTDVVDSTVGMAAKLSKARLAALGARAR